jgi:hypothetical protein
MPPGCTVPAWPSQNLAIRFCSSVRFFFSSMSSCAAVLNPALLYAGGGGGRNWLFDASTHAFHLPASGSVGGDVDPGGGFQKAGPVPMPAGRRPFHGVPAPSVLA